MYNNEKKLQGRLALLVCTLIWGSSFVILKNTLNDVPVMWVLAIRFSGATLLISAVSVKDLKKLTAPCLRGGAVMGTVLFFGYILQTYGLFHTTPGKNAFLTAVYCVVVPFLFWLISKKKPDRYNISAAAICLAGVGLVSLTGNFSVGLGDALTLAGGVFFAFHIIATASATAVGSPLLLTLIQTATATVLSWLGVIFFEPSPGVIPGNAAVALVYLCVICTAGGFFLQTFGQKHTPPSAAAVIMTFEAVFGVLLSVLMGHEDLSIRLVSGFILIFLGVIISETKLAFLRRKIPPEENE